MDTETLISTAVGSFVGSILTLVAVFVAHWLHWFSQEKKEKKRKFYEAQVIYENFFIEMNWNRRKIIYVIKNENYKLAGLENFHWKKFIYNSEASYFLIKDEELVDNLATLDSTTDQMNILLKSFSKCETAMIFNTNERNKKNYNKLSLSIRKYASEELKPQIDKVIPKIDKLYKDSQCA